MGMKRSVPFSQKSAYFPLSRVAEFSQPHQISTTLSDKPLVWMC